MEVDNTDLDTTSFEPKNKNKKQAKSNSDSMETDVQNAQSSKTKQRRPVVVKRISTKRQNEKNQNAEIRKVPVPSHRYTPLKENWLKIFTPIVEHLHLQVRFNLKTRNVEIRANEKDGNISSLQKAADFVRAFVYGFEVDDALALLRLDDLFIETFEIKDVKTLNGDHQSRCVGRLAGKGGRTKFTIENVTKTRIVLADTKIHILGSYQNIQMARRALCNLILGSPASKVYGQLRSVASHVSQRM